MTRLTLANVMRAQRCGLFEMAGETDRIRLEKVREALSVLMLCAPSNRRRPFSYHTKMAESSIFIFCPFFREKMA